jgi:hypothetical protein
MIVRPELGEKRRAGSLQIQHPLSGFRSGLLRGGIHTLDADDHPDGRIVARHPVRLEADLLTQGDLTID